MFCRRDVIRSLIGLLAVGLSGCATLVRRALKPAEVAALGQIREVRLSTVSSTDSASEYLEGLFSAFDFGRLRECECTLIYGADDEEPPRRSVVELTFKNGARTVLLVWSDGDKADELVIVGEGGSLHLANTSLDGTIAPKTARAQAERAYAAIRTAQARPGYLLKY